MRSLGEGLLRDAGMETQALIDHRDTLMTDHYLEGHDTPWQEVQTGSVLVR